MKNEPFVIERILNAPVERVWRAITDKDEMKNWYFDIPEFKPEGTRSIVSRGLPTILRAPTHDKFNLF